MVNVNDARARNRLYRDNVAFVRAIIDIAHLSVRQWALANGYPQQTVESWGIRGGHPVPADVAASFHRDYGVPLSSWPNGVRK